MVVGITVLSLEICRNFAWFVLDSGDWWPYFNDGKSVRNWQCIVSILAYGVSDFEKKFSTHFSHQ